MSINSDYEAVSKMDKEERFRLFPIRLSKHKEIWKRRFLNERTLIIKALGASQIKSINHIGSTAIPDIMAKPIIDILLEIRRDMDIKELVKNMEIIGYGACPRPDMPDPQLSFLKGYTLKGYKGQPFHVHTRYEMEKRRSDFDEIFFKDYLSEHPDTAKEYEALKIELAKEYEYDRDAYTLAKTEFITRVTRAARREMTATARNEVDSENA